MGFLVMNEAFDEWKVPKGQIGPNGYAKYFDEWYERDVQNFVRARSQSSLVVLWSAGNEIGDQGSPQGPETLQKLLQVFHAEDPYAAGDRWLRSYSLRACFEAATPEFLALLDVVGYNYVDRWRDRREKYYSIDRHAFPRTALRWNGERRDGRHSGRLSRPVPRERSRRPEASSNSCAEETSMWSSYGSLSAPMTMLPEISCGPASIIWAKSRWPMKAFVFRRHRYLRLQERRFLFLSKPVDRQASAASISSLELEGKRRAGHPGHLFHELRHR